MALVPKVGPAPAIAAAAYSRPVAGSRNVATHTFVPVEEVSGTAGTTAYGDPNVLAHDYQSQNAEIVAQAQAAAQEGRLRTPTNIFATILESSQTAEGQGSEGEARSTARTRTTAITTYEFNARVVSGTLDTRGDTLNFSL